MKTPSFFNLWLITSWRLLQVLGGCLWFFFFIWEGIFLLQLIIFAILTTQSHVTKQHTLALEQLTVYTAWTLYKAKCPGINWASASIKPVPPILWFFWLAKYREGNLNNITSNNRRLISLLGIADEICILVKSMEIQPRSSEQGFHSVSSYVLHFPKGNHTPSGTDQILLFYLLSTSTQTELYSSHTMQLPNTLNSQQMFSTSKLNPEWWFFNYYF